MLTKNTVASVSSPQGTATSTSAQSVLLICVKYRADKETERYLESIRALETRQKLHVLVVDNTVGGSWVSTSSQFDCRVVQAPANLGYFGGARYGLSLYLAENPLPDWVIISNVDLFIEDTRFLERLAQLSSIPDLGAVAPSIRSARTGIDQNPYLRVRPSALRMHVYKWLYRSRLVLNAYEGLAALHYKVRGALRKLGTSRSRPASREAIYAPHGSFLILAKQYFARGGCLDFSGFLFGEEIYIAESVRKIGLEVIYEPSIEVVHQGHETTKLLKSVEVAKHAAVSAAYCAEVFFPLQAGN